MNYADLVRVTLPETALEIAALLVLVVDLGFLRKAALQTRVMSAVLLGVIGCGAALVALPLQAFGGLTYPGSADLMLSAGGYTAIAQAGILVLTVLTLFLLIGAEFTQHVGAYLAVSTNWHRVLLGLYGPHAFQVAPLLYVALVMIAAGLGFKVAAVPFHLWAPDTYEGAPAPAAAFIASVSKVASFALLIAIGTAGLHVVGVSTII